MPSYFMNEYIGGHCRAIQKVVENLTDHIVLLRKRIRRRCRHMQKVVVERTKWKPAVWKNYYFRGYIRTCPIYPELFKLHLSLRSHFSDQSGDLLPRRP